MQDEMIGQGQVLDGAQVTVPAGIVDQLRRAAYAEIGSAAEALDMVAFSIDREAHPEWFCAPTERLRESYALLDAIGWLRTVPPVDVRIDLHEDCWIEFIPPSGGIDEGDALPGQFCCTWRNMLQLRAMLSPTDIYVLAGALAGDGEGLTLRQLASMLHVDHTLVHRALKRAEAAGLYAPGAKAVQRANFEALMTHAGRFIAPARLGELTRGVPAAWAAEPISTIIRQPTQEPPPVWPDARGRVRGQALEPLHPAAVQASRESPALARLLSIIDSLRAGDVRVRKVAANSLHETLRRTAADQTTAPIVAA